MIIYTAHWKNYDDDYYAPHNRRMFLYREDADKFLDDLINYNGIDNYYILEEIVLDQYSPIKEHYDDYDYQEYDYGDEDWSVDEWSMHNDEMKYYNQLEIDDMFSNRHNDFIWWIGKNVINIDSYWFTSDEIEAFSVIWQRRISAV
jgi:hypothetical protein